ncbi:DMT family transporter [Mycolicibacterium palauense]|uniref:DMT family transporter n=1 Tax=Mycolicibacterium palauense TaxID=2034511 RepID=UPI000BFEEC2A|nr:DMT family transporter [Mycolicibacterium palauense]
MHHIPPMTAAVALGVTAAFLFALSAFLQQRAAHAVTGGDAAALRHRAGLGRLFHGLVRSRTWFAGWLANLLGFGTLAAALGIGSVAVVQPLMAAQLLFVVALVAAQHRRWPAPRDWASALAVSGGLVLLFTTEDAAPLHGDPDRDRILLATACAAGLTVALIVLGRRSRTWLASMLVGVAAGLCHAMNSVFLKLTIDDLSVRGVGATAVDWPGYALAGSTLAGLLLGQLAFASGALPPAVAAISTTNPVASFAVGVLAFDVPAPTGAHALVMLGFSGVLIAAGITGLAYSSEAREVYGRAGDAGPARHQRGDARTGPPRAHHTEVDTLRGGSGR